MHIETILNENAEKSGKINDIMSMKSSFLADVGRSASRNFMNVIDSYIWGSVKMMDDDLRSGLQDLDIYQLKELENELQLIVKKA